MRDIRYKNSVPLSANRKADLLNRLDAATAPGAAPAAGRMSRRESKRWAFRRCDIAVVIEHPAGGASRNLVCARNLSAGGMSFLHGGFVHPGSRCSIVLIQLDGQLTQATGQVVSCRHVEGLVHEIGLKFDRHVDPRAFVVAATSQPVGALDGDAPCPASLQGRVLCVDDSESDRLLLAHHLRETAVELTAVADGRAALEALSSQTFDVILCGLNLAGENGRELILKIREDGFAGPLVLFTAETDGKRIELGLEAGADHLLNKPYEAEQLFNLLRSLMPQPEAPPAGPSLCSTMEHEPGMARLIETFIEQASRIAQQIRHTIDEGRADQARELCLNVKGTAASLGFQPLSDEAAEVLTALNAAPSLEEASDQLRQLSDTCRRLAMHGDGGRSSDLTDDSAAA